MALPDLATLRGEDLFKFDFDPVALKARYIAERDKRLNPKGNDQYKWIQHDNEHAELLKDPWTAPIVREPLSEDLTALVLGGGFSGIFMGKNLRDAKIDNFRIIEKGGDFGGTWYWNRYPGAACDSEAYCYLPLLESTSYMPKSKYTRAPEILEHCNRMGTMFNLYERTLFQTECIEARWDDSIMRWICKTDRGDVLRVQFLVSSTGPLHKIKLPGVPGIEKFKKTTFHTARWNYDYTGGDSFGNLNKLADKRVAIIGTGATAIQCIPNSDTDPEWWRQYTSKPGWQIERDTNFIQITSGNPQPVDLVSDMWTDMFNYQYAMMAEHAKGIHGQQYKKEDLMELADFVKMERIRKRVDEVVKDKKTAEALKPFYRRMCKRPTFSDTYLQTFNRPNVTLVDTNGQGIDCITENGVVYDGKEYEVDCIIWGTGFEIGTSWKSRNGFELIGKDGVTLQQKWRKGMRSLYGVCSRGFPNHFMFQNAQAGRSVNFPWTYAKQANWSTHIITECLKRGVAAFDVDATTEENWMQEIVKKSLLDKNFLTECTPGYYNFEGQTNRLVARNTSYGGGPVAYAKLLEQHAQENKLRGLELFYEKDLNKPKL